jgi:hypothetical protein
MAKIQRSHCEVGAYGKWLDKPLAKSLQEINIKGQSTRWMTPTSSRMGFESHAIMSVAVALLWNGGRGDDSTRTSMLDLIVVVARHLSITVACI